MEVINTKPFEVVFTFTRHPNLGVLVEANAVQLLENGNPSLTYQRIREKTADYFGLNPEQKHVVEIIEGLEDEAIKKRFYKGTKKIKAVDFYIKSFDEETKKTVLEFVEKELLKILREIKNYHMYWAGKTGEPMGSLIEFHNEPSTPLFHFRRDEEGMNYFVTIKHRDEKVHFCDPESELLTSQPAWLLTPTKLLFFGANVEGKKIKPFLKKKFIHIDPHQEAAYMQKFVGPLLENHDVFALGFDIVTDQLEVKPVLKLTSSWENPHIILYMQYGDWVFPYHVNKKVNVRLESTENTYTFHRIKRLYSVEKEKIESLKELGLKQTNGSIFSLQNEDSNAVDVISWINENRAVLERSGFEIQQEQCATEYYLGPIQLLVTVKNGIDWFDVHAIMKLDGFEIPFIKLRKHIIERRREYTLPNGKIVILPAEWFDQFAQIVNLADIHDESYRIRNIHVSLLSDLDEYLNEAPPTPEWSEALAHGKIPMIDLPSQFVGELRNYQLEGFRWINFMHQNHFGALLADDMGLGKTIQTLAHLQVLASSYRIERIARSQLGLTINGETLEVTAPETPSIASDGRPLAPVTTKMGPILIITPKSLLYNWMSESAKFCPDLKAALYSGLARNKVLGSFDVLDVVVMSYGTMRNDVELLREYKFNCIVLDESQAIKNPSSQTSRALLKVQSRNKIALTGTPIENTLLDIWSQMNFLNPGMLGSVEYFRNEFATPIDKFGEREHKDHLKKLLYPFILRRTKEQVAKDLPAKTETILFCEMEEEQRNIYDAYRNDYRDKILGVIKEQGIDKSQLTILQGLMKLRQICDSPAIMNEKEQMPNVSVKLDELTREITENIGNHKALVFSQFLGMLGLIRQKLTELGVKFEYFDGSTSAPDREKAIQSFQNDDEVRVFLISLKAGGVGLNLTAADYVYIVDPWWNPAVEQQAIDRTHRIGQTKNIFAYRMICKDTIEDKILQLQDKKRSLARDLVADDTGFVKTLTREDVEYLFS